MMYLWQIIKSYIYVSLRCILKAFLRRTTGLCELQRISYRYSCGAKRTHYIEYSIEMSRSSVLRKIDRELSGLALNGALTTSHSVIDLAVEATTIDKHINICAHQHFVRCYRLCLLQIYGYKQLISLIMNGIAIRYDSRSDDHIEMLTKLWQQLMDVPLSSMVSKQWCDIGFQGDDPSTDFRGMGLLGLENLLYFATNYQQWARHILQHSLHPIHGYPFAIVGINLTHMTFNLLKSGRLKTHFYNSHQTIFIKEDFHKVYCYMFVAFDKLWLSSQPQSVMEFNYIRDKFEAIVVSQLADYNTKLKWDPNVETL